MPTSLPSLRRQQFKPHNGRVSAVRVLFNGVTTLKPKTGIAHAAANLHTALVANFPEDTFWLYPGERVARLARRYFQPSDKLVATSNKNPPSFKHLVKRAVGGIAKFGYATHFQATARTGRFDLYHE